jgi:hypothetical protein
MNTIKSVAITARIAQSVQRRATGRTAAVHSPIGARDFSLLHTVQIGCISQPASSPMVTEGSIPRGKAAWSAN